MNILLINPPRSPENAILAHAPEAAKRFIHKKLIGPPLGLLTVAAAVKEHNVTVLDTKAEYDSNPHAPALEALVRQYCEKTKPEIIGITCIASEFPDSMRILESVKQWDPGVLTVAGGLHASLCPQDFAGTLVDIVCSGQAGQTFREIVSERAGKREYLSIGGTYVNTPAGFQQSQCPPGKINAVVDDPILPDRSYIKQWLPAYRMPHSEKNITYINTSYGCPFKCSFCSIWPQWKGRYFLRDTESIIAELRSLEDYGIVRFADANSVIDEAYTHRLFFRIAEERLDKEFVMDIRADTAANNPKLVERMAKAGLKVAICGFESFRKSELDAYNKHFDPSLIRKAVSVFHDNGVQVRGNYVVPPDYDEQDFDALAVFADAQRVTYAGYTVLTPMPGTELYSSLKNSIIDFDLRKYNFFNCVLKTKLPIDKFHEKVGALWLIKKGNEVA
ncbi:MAG TPA: radical SAM protein [Chitinivibrionales bacterium]|nr:radical SAM protein [Chitinivibrionales bacterium]